MASCYLLDFNITWATVVYSSRMLCNSFHVNADYFMEKKAMAEPRRLCTSQGFTLLTVNMCECPFTLGMCQLSTLKNNSGDLGSKSQPHVRDELLGLIYLLTLHQRSVTPLLPIIQFAYR